MKTPTLEDYKSAVKLVWVEERNRFEVEVVYAGVLGDVMGSVGGDVWGHVERNVKGNVYGDVEGSVKGIVVYGVQG